MVARRPHWQDQNIWHDKTEIDLPKLKLLTVFPIVDSFSVFMSGGRDPALVR